MKPYHLPWVARILHFFGPPEGVLLWTLWRSGTHWLAGMLSDMTWAAPFYRSDGVTDYGEETLRQVRWCGPHRILIRHICLEPESLFATTDPLGYRVILLYRDPRDVLASQVNMRKYREGLRPGLPPFPQMTPAEILSWELRTYGAFYREALPRWVACSSPSLIKVSYEALLRDGVQQLERLDAFLGLHLPRSRLASIYSRNSFQRQARRAPGEEDKGSHRRRGIIGDHRSQFSGDDLARIALALGEAPKRMGYV